MNSVIRWFKKYWPIIPALLILIFSTLSVLEVWAQEDLVTELNHRFIQLGVPVKDVVVANRLPFQITIILQSNTTGDQRTAEDASNEYLAEREATLAHKFGLNLDSFIITLVNKQGKEINWSEIFLDPRYINKIRQFSSANKHLDNQATETLLKDQLDFQGLAVDELTVTTGVGSEQDVQSVSIRLSAPSLEATNRAIPDLIGSLMNRLKKINRESDSTLVAVCRLWILDSTGNILLSYLYDLELESQTWGMAPGVTNDWFPHPEGMPTIAPILPTATPASYPPPIMPTVPAYP